MSILLRKAWILTMDDDYTEYPCGWLLTDGDRIAAMGEGTPPDADEIIDCGGGILLPGFVNTHCHASMIPFRSMGDDCPDRLRRFLFPLENEAVTPEMVYAAACYGMAEMLLSGITTFVDMYYFEEEVARAALDMGIRAYVGETLISQKAPDAEQPAEALRVAERMLRQWAGHDRIHPILAPHGTTTVSPEVLRAAGELSAQYNALYTVHTAEMDYEMKQFAEQGTTPMGYLASLGLCNDRLLAVHCIHMTEGDIALMRSGGARVAHCIGANMKAGKGIPPAKRFAEEGIPFGLGTDGPASGNTLSLFSLMRLFALAHKTANHDRALFPAREIVAIATRGGAAALHGEDTYGILRPGMKADCVLVRTDSPHIWPVYNPYSALVYAANASDVRLVLADGRVLVRDGVLTAQSMQELRARLAERMPAFRQAAEKYRDVI